MPPRVIVALIVLCSAQSSLAGTSLFLGELRIHIGNLEPAVMSGSGVATFNGGAGGTHVSTLTLPSNAITGTDVIPVTDPESISANGIISIRLTATLSAGTLGKILPGGSASTVQPLNQNTLGLANGLARLCLISFDCATAYIPVPIAGSGTGLGVGGQQTVQFGALRESVDFRPWTIMTATAIGQLPNFGSVSFSGGMSGTSNFVLVKRQGFAHGPASAASTVAIGTPSFPGALQFVTPTQVTTNQPSILRIPVLTDLGVRVVPEPGMLILLLVGVGGLAGMGWVRHRS